MSEEQKVAEAPNNPEPKFVDYPSKDKVQKDLVFDYSCEVDGEVLSGKFRVLRQNINRYGAIQALLIRLNEGTDMETLDPNTYHLNKARAHLQISVVESPDWWKEHISGEAFDATHLVNVWKHVRQWESSFRRQGVGA